MIQVQRQLLYRNFLQVNTTFALPKITFTTSWWAAVQVRQFVKFSPVIEYLWNCQLLQRTSLFMGVFLRLWALTERPMSVSPPCPETPVLDQPSSPPGIFSGLLFSFSGSCCWLSSQLGKTQWKQNCSCVFSLGGMGGVFHQLSTWSERSNKHESVANMNILPSQCGKDK